MDTKKQIEEGKVVLGIDETSIRINRILGAIYFPIIVFFEINLNGKLNFIALGYTEGPLDTPGLYKKGTGVINGFRCSSRSYNRTRLTGVIQYSEGFRHIGINGKALPRGFGKIEPSIGGSIISLS